MLCSRVGWLLFSRRRLKRQPLIARDRFHLTLFVNLDLLGQTKRGDKAKQSNISFERQTKDLNSKPGAERRKKVGEIVHTLTKWSHLDKSESKSESLYESAILMNQTLEQFTSLLCSQLRLRLCSI